MPDWIDSFMFLTETVRSPVSFRLWTAITTIACTLERRVWTATDVKPLFPNLYTILAGAPASGKTIMVDLSREMLSILSKPGGIVFGPDNPSAASFMDCLAASTKISINGMGIPMYSAMTIHCRELGDLMSKYDKDFAAKLTTLYDNPTNYTMPRRTAKSLNIEAPNVNMLAGATPDALGDTIPESAWGQGLTSRLIFIYGIIPELRRRIFIPRHNTDMTGLQTDLKRFFEDLHGVFEWEEPAQVAMDRWFNDEKMAPVPTYGRLANYRGRRDVHVMKLAMISAVSADRGLTVTLKDFQRAQKWLFEAEETMPDVFRAMAQKSDTQILQDCHYWLYVKYSRVDRNKRKAIPEREIASWFEDKTTHDKIQSFVIAMEKTGRMRRSMVPGEWIPNPIDTQGVSEVNEVPNSDQPITEGKQQ